MGKGFVLVDIPERCSMCRYLYCTDEDYCFCSVEGFGFDYQVNEYMQLKPNGKPNWCPIRKLPNFDNEDYYPDEYMDGYSSGWNSCLNNILNSKQEENNKEYVNKEECIDNDALRVRNMDTFFHDITDKDNTVSSWAKPLLDRFLKEE